MIEANCVACGTLNRIAEGDVPAGAKFVTCSSCKSRVALPTGKTQLPSPPAPPSVPKLGGVPPIPKAPPPVPKLPVPGAKPAAPAAAAAAPALDLADLPAPKRPSVLGGEASKPAPKSGLAAALDEDLPAPRTKGGASAAIDLDDLIAPASAKSSEAISDLPAPKPRSTAAVDLPAPKSRPTPLPAKVEPQGADLPAPKPKTAAATPPSGVTASTPPRPGGARALTDFDLAKPGIADLPTPKVAAAPKAAGGAFDLELDLPAPKAVGGEVAPKGFFDDLPTPVAPSVGGDIAPKGFFDDLPQPVSAKPASVGGDIAPKGFFDDLPQPATSKPGPGEIAPKGFFDDLPQPAQGGGKQVPGEVAPKGFFDDLPQPSRTASKSASPAALSDSISLDLGDSLELSDLGGSSPAPAPAAKAPAGNTFDALDLAGDDGPALELEGAGAGTASSAFSLGAPISTTPPPKAASSNSFDDLDLGAPSVGPAAAKTPPPADGSEGEPSVIRFDKPKAKAPGADKAPLPSLSTKPGPASGGDLALELEGEAGLDKPKATPRPERKKAPERAKNEPLSKKKRMLLAGAVLGVAALGGGGFFFYKRHVAAQARADEISGYLNGARKALAADDDLRWQRAAISAAKVLELEPTHGEALGIGAEAAIAGAFADGKNQPGRFAKGRKMIADALAAGHTGPALDRAQALSALTSQPAQAAQKIQALLGRTPNDAALKLYLGWAFEAAGDLPAAIKAYDAATSAAPVKVLALLGRARVKLLQADIEGAKADFLAILAINKDHIPAQVGLAATLPSSQSVQQESDLLAVLKRSDIGQADARAVTLAWVLAGDVARRGGRYDAARERYRKALEINDKDLGAGTGLAEVELLDGKLGLASEQITKVLTQTPNDAIAQLIATELAIVQKQYDDAATRLGTLSQRTPPLPPLQQSRLLVVTGKLHEAKDEQDAAADAYVEAAKLAGERDLAPTMLAVAKLSQLARAADGAKNPERAAGLRQRAEQLLTAFAAAADKDPSIAFALGTAYTQAGDPAKGEEWLRKVYAARPKDPDVLYQLGKALAAQGKGDEAVKFLLEAVGAAPARLEISLELARTYDALKKPDEAEAVFDKLVAAEDASLEARGHAGKFYAKLGKLDKAGVQGEKILAGDPNNAAGHYLKGEGLLAAGKFDAARKEFSDAVRIERDPQFLDGQGRATEKMAMPIGSPADPALQEAAVRAYQAAHELDPTMLNPLVGQGRIFVKQRVSKAALEVLLKANALLEKADETKRKQLGPEIARLLGIAYNNAGEKIAKQWLELANKNEPTAEVSFLLAKIYEAENVSRGLVASTYGSAYRLAREDEVKRGIKLPAWYLDALYLYAQFTMDEGNCSAAKSAFLEFLGSNPGAGPRVDTAKKHLATALKNC